MAKAGNKFTRRPIAVTGTGRGILRLEGDARGDVGVAGGGVAVIGGRPIIRKSVKEWVLEAYARRPNELRAMSITDAARALSREAKDAPDYGRSLKVGHCVNLLRTTGGWSKKPRG